MCNTMDWHVILLVSCQVRLSVCNSREVRQRIDEHKNGRLSEERAGKGDTLDEDIA
jgi:hypothetical protein